MYTDREKSEFAKIQVALKEQKNFDIISMINKGKFGIVFKAKNPEDSETYAIKIMSCNIENDQHGNDQRRELLLLAQMAFSDNPNVVKYFGSWKMQVVEEQMLCIQMELCSRNLQDFLYNNKFSSKIIQAKDEGQPRFYQQVLKQILNGLHAIHSAGWVHRDIHLGNILTVHPNPQQISDIAIKIGDFGLARPIYRYFHISPEWTIKVEDVKCDKSPCFKPDLFRAPEIFTNTYNSKVDLYNAGIVLYFISRYHEKKDVKELISEIEKLKKRKVKAKEYVYHKDDEKLCNLIENLLEPMPHKRPSALEATKYMFPVPAKAVTFPFYAKKDGENILKRCSLNKLTLAALTKAVTSRFGEVEKLWQECVVNNSKEPVEIEHNEDVKVMFSDDARIEKDKRDVVIVVRVKPDENSNFAMEQEPQTA